MRSKPADDTVSLEIDGKSWAYCENLEIHLGLDSHASAGFSVPFEPGDQPGPVGDRERMFRRTFQPFSFKPLTVSIGRQRVFTGTMIDITPRLAPDRREVTVAAYSLPAVLDECSVSIDSIPLQSTGLSLMQIAERLVKPYGILAVVSPEAAKAANGRSVREQELVYVGNDPAIKAAIAKERPDAKKQANAAFAKVSPEVDQQVGDFLAEMARQRGLVVSSTPTGELLFLQSVKPGNPVASLREGEQPLIEVVPTFDPQSYFNEITGFTSAKRGRAGSRYTERVNRLSGGQLRAHNFKLDDVEVADAPAAVRAKVGRMYGNMATYVVNLPTWRDPKDNLWQPNTTIVIDAPSAMIYGPYEFLIRDVYLKASAGEKTASLGLVLPGAFSGERPAYLPWDPPLVSEDFPLRIA